MSDPAIEVELVKTATKIVIFENKVSDELYKAAEAFLMERFNPPKESKIENATFDDKPLQEHIEEWLAANNLKCPSDVRWGKFPLGMVVRLMDRAKRVDEAHEFINDFLTWTPGITTERLLALRRRGLAWQDGKEQPSQ